jgi:hypothetical protein
MVPTLQCGLLRSNFSFAISLSSAFSYQPLALSFKPNLFSDLYGTGALARVPQ